ncbi:MAG: hypothetical protein KGJ79_03665 [Alphaproteobacteria bacterium]|nr:hypothetical protein [Alphaproteobacteria bacterium]MDE2493744.1 hypothetical protein [Alphaproteobacteria bacterium]
MDNALAAGQGGSLSAPARQSQDQVRRRTMAARLTQANARRPQGEPRRKTIIRRVQLLTPLFGHSFASAHDLPLDGLTADSALSMSATRGRRLTKEPLDARRSPFYTARNGFGTLQGGVLPL